jgi:class 3 adenylate cyclase
MDLVEKGIDNPGPFLENLDGAVLFADISGFSKLAEKLEKEK